MLSPGGGRRLSRPHIDPLDPDADRVRPPHAIAPELLLRSTAKRFAAAIEIPAEDGCLAGDEEICRQLRHAPIIRMARLAGTTNATLLVELDDGNADSDEPLRAIYKPTRGEHPLWDFPHHTLHFREVASYLVSAALDTDLISPTVLRDGPFGPGSMQHFVEQPDAELTERERQELEPDLMAMAALDVLINNADRKSSHLMVNRAGRLRGIDHGLTFLPYPRQRTVLLGLGGSPLPAATAATIRALDRDEGRRDALLRRLAQLLARQESEAFSARLRELAADPTYPELDPEDGRPFEWW